MNKNYRIGLYIVAGSIFFAVILAIYDIEGWGYLLFLSGVVALINFWTYDNESENRKQIHIAGIKAETKMDNRFKVLSDYDSSEVPQGTMTYFRLSAVQAESIEDAIAMFRKEDINTDINNIMDGRVVSSFHIKIHEDSIRNY